MKKYHQTNRYWNSFHGGGFALGNLDNEEGRVLRNHPQGERLTQWLVSSCIIADGCHAAVFNVDYRLAPEHPFPTGLEDSYDVVKWVSRYLVTLAKDDRSERALGGCERRAPGRPSTTWLCGRWILCRKYFRSRHKPACS